MSPDSRQSRSPRLFTLALAGLLAALGLAAFCGGVWAAYSGNSGNSGNELVAVADWSPPIASATVIGKSQGGVPGYIHQGGAYNVYASVADGGNPASGVAGVTANVSTLTAGQSAAALSSGSFSIGGAGYGYRGAGLTAAAVLPAGTYSYSLTSKDAAANTGTQSGYTVIVDNTAPTASDIQAINKSGNTAGKAELGDSMIYTFSEPIDPNSILAGWSGAATNVVARLTNVTNDPFTVFNNTNTTQLPLGSVNMGRNDYAIATATFGASGTASSMVMSGNTITVTLGTASSGATAATSTGTMIWSPSASAYDRAGNAESTGTRTETGTADKDF